MISLYLELSTCHITPDTAHKLNAMVGSDSAPIIVYEKANGGWFIPLLKDCFTADIPDDLKTVFQFAKEHRCRWVIFDPNAGVYKKLPKYTKNNLEGSKKC